MSVTISGSGQIIKQVVQAVKTDTFSWASGSFTDITGMSVSITPTNASNKILILVNCPVSTSSADAVDLRLVRNSTAICIGDAASVRIQASVSGLFQSDVTSPCSIMFLDAPATTSATTYKIQGFLSTGTGYGNRSSSDNDNTAHYRLASTITVMEVAYA